MNRLTLLLLYMRSALPLERFVLPDFSCQKCSNQTKIRTNTIDNRGRSQSGDGDDGSGSGSGFGNGGSRVRRFREHEASALTLGPFLLVIQVLFRNF